MNYYNEFDPQMAAWLRELIAEGDIPPGYVDERSILDVRPHELYGYTSHHFFCGIAGWPLALRLAGWPDDRPVITGSCPCQPFSIAGKGKGEADARHLWPNFRDLITFGKPTVTFGEQVASPDGRAWLAGVRADLKALGYEVGGADLCAACIGAPHIRQRLFWVAEPNGRKCHGITDGKGRERDRQKSGRQQGDSQSKPCGDSGRMADASSLSGPQHEQQPGEGSRREERPGDVAIRGGNHGGLAHGEGIRCGQIMQDPDGSHAGSGAQGRAAGHGGSCAPGGMVHPNGDRCQQGSPAAAPAGYRDTTDAAGFWDDSRWIKCRDGKLRRIPTQSEIFPLASRIPYKLARRGSARPALIKGAGNAIVPELAAIFIQAFLTA